jgi:hypothetical protein
MRKSPLLLFASALALTGQKLYLKPDQRVKVW